VKHNIGKISLKVTTLNLKLLNPNSYEEVMNFQRHGSHNLRILGLSLGSLKKFSHFDVLFVINHKMYYEKEGGGLFPSLDHVSVTSPRQVHDPKLTYVCFNHLHCLICANDLFMKF
jgi:hypothetical protein